MRKRITRTAVMVATAALLFASCSSDAAKVANATSKKTTTTISATTTEAPGASTTVAAAPGASTSTTAPKAGSKPGSNPENPENPDTATKAAVAPIGTYPVGNTRIDLVDTSRKTAANGSASASEGRKLPTEVFYPAAGSPPASTGSGQEKSVGGAPARDGRYPLIVFSHGVTGRGIFYRGELEAWASAGYVVIAPDYPLSNFDSPGGPTINDVGNQPADASFLIDTFLDEAGGTPAAKVARQIDAAHIGAAGHSLGAITSLGLGYLPCCVEDRIAAIASWAGAFLPLQNGKAEPDQSITDRPLLLVHGDQDRTVPYRASESIFDKVASPRWFVSLPGEGHVDPFLSPGTSDAAALVTQVTLDFFDAQLKGDTAGISRLEAAVAAAGPIDATIESAGT